MNGNGITSVAGAVRAMQIIRLALVMGVVSFAGVVLFLKLTGGGPKGPAIPNPLFPNFPLVLLIGAFFGVTAVLASFVLPGVLEANGRKQVAAKNLSNEDEVDLALVQVAQTLSVIRGALVEGVSFLLTISSMIEGHWWGLMWLVPLIALQLITMPTQTSIEEWIRTQKEWMRMER